MKRIKRILAVILLIVMVLMVSYLLFTGSRLFSFTEDNMNEQTEAVYENKTNF